MGQEVKNRSRVCPLPPGPLEDLNRHLRPRTIFMAVSLTLILTSTGLMSLMIQSQIPPVPLPEVVDVPEGEHPDYLTHYPFNITSNEDFISQGWPGNGTANDPFVISGLSIETGGLCIGIFNTTNHFVIRDCNLTRDPLFEFQYRSNWGNGVLLANVTNGVVENNEFSEWQNGILLDNVISCRISKNSMQHCHDGILSYSMCNTTLLGNTFTDFGNGIKSYGSSNCTVADNIFPYSGWMGSHGIVLWESDGCVVESNTIDAISFGIYLSGNNSRIAKNTVNGCIRLWSRSRDCQLEQNNIYGAVLLQESQNCTLRNNMVHDSDWGVQLENSTDCLIAGNLVYDITMVGIYLKSSDSNSVVNNTCSRNDIGISIYASSFNIVANNTCNNNRIGIYLVYPCWYSNSVTNNTYFGNIEHNIIQGFETEEVRVDRLSTLSQVLGFVGLNGFAGVILLVAVWRMVKLSRDEPNEG